MPTHEVGSDWGLGQRASWAVQGSVDGWCMALVAGSVHGWCCVGGGINVINRTLSIYSYSNLNNPVTYLFIYLFIYLSRREKSR